jgi:tetratricopeptide (TPR) repeat protein
LAQAHTSLAMIRFVHLEGGDIEGEFRRAIALDPGYAQGIHWYALYLAATGRKAESIREIKLAREIDPKSLIINANIGWCYYLADDFDHAEEAAKNTIQMDPSFVASHSYLGQVYAARRRYTEAIQEYQTALSLSPGDLTAQAQLANGYATAGKKREAQEILQEMQTFQGKQYVSAYDFAIVYAGLRDVSKTLDWLDKAYVERNGRLVNLAVHPEFAFLRSEPRFQNVIEKIWRSKLITEQSP